MFDLLLCLLLMIILVMNIVHFGLVATQLISLSCCPLVTNFLEVLLVLFLICFLISLVHFWRNVLNWYYSSPSLLVPSAFALLFSLVRNPDACSEECQKAFTFDVSYALVTFILNAFFVIALFVERHESSDDEI